LKVKILGAGWYGCSIASGLISRGHYVELHESAPHIFAGASGANPARLHQGQHYPRSRLTRAFCQEHHAAFMSRYGSLTRCVPINIYAVASDDSYLDFGTYCQVLRGEIEFITIWEPSEYGLLNVEGAILTGERHIVISEARSFFENDLDKHIVLNADIADQGNFDWVVDCTFCANDAQNIDRYEACVTYILEGPTNKAVTIMDGPFPSLYPWNEELGLNSLTSAKYTPIKRCGNWREAKSVINTITKEEITARGHTMFEQLCHYWPDAADLYSIADHRLSIRAMPKSAADARLVDIVHTGPHALRVRAGKIDAVLHAEQLIANIIEAAESA